MFEKYKKNPRIMKTRAKRKVHKKNTEIIIEIRKLGFKIPIIAKVGDKGAIIRNVI